MGGERGEGEEGMTGWTVTVNSDRGSPGSIVGGTENYTKVRRGTGYTR